MRTQTVMGFFHEWLGSGKRDTGEQEIKTSEGANNTVTALSFSYRDEKGIPQKLSIKPTTRDGKPALECTIGMG
jgi:hypothetical protein